MNPILDCRKHCPQVQQLIAWRGLALTALAMLAVFTVIGLINTF